MASGPSAAQMTLRPSQASDESRCDRPQIGCRTGLGDEALHGAEAHAEQGRCVVGERAGERRNGVQVRPDRGDRVRGCRRAGRQRSPISGATRAGSGRSARRRDTSAAGRARRVHQIAEVVEADRADVLRRDIVETADVDFFAGGMNQQRLIGEADVGPHTGASGRFAWPLRPVGRSGKSARLSKSAPLMPSCSRRAFYRTVFVALSSRIRINAFSAGRAARRRVSFPEAVHFGAPSRFIILPMF